VSNRRGVAGVVADHHGWADLVGLGAQDRLEIDDNDVSALH
jgi:hypothetical protein